MINFNSIFSLCREAVVFLQAKVNLSLSPLQKKIAALALITFTGLAVCCMLFRRYCFTATPIFKQGLEGELHFRWQDIEFLAQHRIGVRHVSNRTQAQHEALNGFTQGCSLSLSPQYCKLTKQQKKKMKDVTIKERDAFTKHFEEGVDSFIDGSCVMDLNSKITLGKTTLGEIISLVNRCCLSLVNYDTFWSPCDFSQWGEGLGRYPKLSVEGKNITLLPFIEEHHLGYSEKDKQKVITSKEMGNEIFSRIAACYRTAIVRQIRQGI